MATEGDICFCVNCGQKIGYYKKNSVGEVKPPDNAITQWKYGGFVINSFCTKRCKEEYKSKKESSKSETIDTFEEIETEPQLTAEQIKAQAEAEEMRARIAAEERRIAAEERRIRELVAREKLEADKAKAKELKANGKRWLALWTSIGENGRYAVGIGLAVAWFFGISSFSNIIGAIEYGELIFIEPGPFFMLILALAGTVFAGLVLKDSIK